MSNLDPNRAEAKTPQQIAREGCIFNLNSGAIFTGNEAPMRFIVWPGSGCRMLGGHLGIHEYGQAFKPHVHPISEDCIFAFRFGEGYLRDKYVDVMPGDLIYAPAGVLHGTAHLRRPGPDFLAHGYAAPPQFDLYQWAGYFREGHFDWEAIKHGNEAPLKRDIVISNEVLLGAVPDGGEERAERKTLEDIRENGAIFNINGGIPFAGFGPLVRFVVAPFTGSRLIAATAVFHEPGQIFELHSHYISDEANVVVRGSGEVCLGGRWSSVKAGDILYVPPRVEHATRNPAENADTLVIVSFSSPPPFDLYSRAGIFKEGRFVGV